MIVWFDSINDIVIQEKIYLWNGLTLSELFGFINDEYDNLGCIYCGY